MLNRLHDFRTLSILRLGLLGLVAFSLASCTRSTSGPQVGKQIFFRGNGAEPKDLDPNTMTGQPEHHIAENLFEGLVEKHPEHCHSVPGAAERWTISKDGLSFTFYLRKNAKWSNGEPVTAKDFVYGWTRLLKPETAAEFAYQGYYFKNGKAFNTGKLKDASQLGFKAVDDYTLKVQLENPTPFFLRLLAHASLYPIHQATVEKHGMSWTKPGKLVGNGAFMLAEWKLNQDVVLKPNPHYWDRASVKLEEAHILPVEKLDTEEKMFRSGKLHVTNEVPPDKIPVWRKDPGGVFENHPLLATYFYWFNVEKKPMDNKHLRRALVLSVDRQKLVDHVTLGGQMPGMMYTPPGAGGFQPKRLYPSDLSRLEEAKQELKKAGYADGSKVPEIQILYNTHDGHKKIAEAIQQMWRENLGLTNVTLMNQEWKVYLDTMTQGNFQAGRQGWVADYNDPNTFLDMMMSDNSNNRGRFKSAAYDAVMAKAQSEGNSAKRMEYFQQAENIIADEAPVLPLYIYTHSYLRAKEVRGYWSNIEDYHPLKYVSLEWEK